MGHGPQINSAYDKTKKRYDYSGVFNPLEGIISSVDFAIANLARETNLSVNSI